MMKQKLFLLFALLLGTLAPHSVLSYDFSSVAPTGQTLYYTITNTSTHTVSVVPQNSSSPYYSSVSPSGVLEIPASVTYNGTSYSVTSIGYAAFYDCSGLTGTLTIPNSVTSIEAWGFGNCSGLTSATIANSVTSIGKNAFRCCTGLTSVSIPNSVTTIGCHAFDSCINLQNIVLSNNLSRLDTSLFLYCRGLTSITIPNSVTSIGYGAFYGCTGLTSVTIPNSVTSIEAWGFGNCSGLTSVTLGNSVTSIGQQAFYGCIGLTSITIPNSVTSIEAWGFGNCSGLTSATIGNSVTSIGKYAFTRCTGLTGTLTIPNSVTTIGCHAFDSCISLQNIVLSNNLSRIDTALFQHCTGLTSVTIPNSVTSIGYYAFAGCTGLTSVTIPNSVTSIGYYAFAGCTGLTSVTIPNSVTSIGSAAFFYCTGLSSVTIGNSVTSIEEYAFQTCTGLTSVTIPNSVTSIGQFAFSGCTGLTSVTIPNSVISIGFNTFYRVNNVVYNGSLSGCPWGGKTCNGYIEDSLIYSDATKTTLTGFVSGLSVAIIPNSVTSIGNSAFYGCTSLTSVTIPNSVTSIGGWAFEGCTGLTSLNYNAVNCSGAGFSYDYNWLANCNALTTVNIGNSVERIPAYAFYGCTGLTNVTIPNSVTCIGDCAFYDCTGLTSVTIPNSVTSIGSYAFNSVNNVIYNGNLSGCPWGGKNCNGYIEDSLIYSDATKTTLTGFVSGLSVAIIPNSVTSIGNSAFYGCTSLTSVTIPNSVTSIGGWAFEGCTGLTSVTIPESVTSIYYRVFYNCTGLTTLNYNAINCSGNSFTVSDSYPDWHWLRGCTNLTTVNIGNSVERIPACAFYGCTGLTSVTIGNSVTSIGSSAFYNCTGLTSVTIPNSVRSFGYGVFRDCTGLTSVTIGNSVTNINDSLFYGCTGLTSVTIPNSVTRIGNYAFRGCSGLTSVTIGNSVTSIGKLAFSGCIGLATMNYNAVNCGGDGFTPDYYNNYNGWLFGSTALTSVNIGNSVARIPNYAFHNCTSLNSVTIPNSVTSIGEHAFSYCTNLNTINYNATNCSGDGFTTSSWLRGCSSLTRVNVGNNVRSIPENAFSICTGLRVLDLGSGLTSVGANAFYNCDHLDSIYSRSTTPPTVANTNAFENVWKGLPLTVPTGSRSAYAVAYAWRDFTNIVEMSAAQFTVTVNVNDASMGTVTGGGTYAQGATATLSATANTGYRFVQWNDGNTQNPRTVTVTADATYMAFFAANQYTVAVYTNDSTMGTVTGGGTYVQGATATLSATANTGYRFVQWNDGNTDNPRTVTVTGNATYTAYFAADQSNAPQIAYVGVDSNGHNAVSWTPQSGTSPVRYNVYREGIQAGVYELVGVVNASGAASYSWTDDQSNPATRAYSYRLAEVAADNTESDLSIPHTTIHLQISQGQGDAWNLAWTPYVGFNYSTYNLYRGTDASSMTLLTTLPATATTYSDLNTGGTAYYYQIEVVQLSGAKTTAVSSRSNIVTTDPDPQTYTLTVLSADVLRGTVTGGGSYTEGTMATLTAEANEGYVFLQWQDGSTANPRNILVTANGTYMAYFTQTEGIADAEGSNVTIIARNGRILVSGAEGRQVTLSDALGRILYRGTATESLTVEAPATGIYLLQVEGHPAHRISVVR